MCTHTHIQKCVLLFSTSVRVKDLECENNVVMPFFKNLRCNWGIDSEEKFLSAEEAVIYKMDS